jgi:hypothetical protein
MERYNGGTKVAGGYYFNTTNWEFTTITGEQGTLPGTAQAQYIRTPLLALFVVAPVAGAAFAMFLPLIGFALPVYALGRALVNTGRDLVQDAAATIAPQWHPGEAHLAGKANPEQGAAPGAEKAAGQDPGELARLQAEIEAKRIQEKK